MKIDLTSRNATIGIILVLELAFLALAVVASMKPSMEKVEGKAWDLFAGTNAALFLALKTDSKDKESAPVVVPQQDQPESE